MQDDSCSVKPARAGLSLALVLFYCAITTLPWRWLVRAEQQQPAPTTTAPVLISALHYFGREGNADEGIQLTNVSSDTVTLDDAWSLSAPFGTTTRTLRFTGQTLAPGEQLWLANSAPAFSRQFGFSPTLSYAQISGTALSLANTGGWVKLTRSGDGAPVDVVVYGSSAPQPGWSGAPVQPFTVTGQISADGQVLQRRFAAGGGLPLADRDSAADWLNTTLGPLDQGRPAYPGWDLARFAVPASGAGTLTAAVAPDSSHALVMRAFQSATATIDLSSYTFDHAGLGLLLAERVRAGVRVRLLLDGAPAGGLSDQTRWICAQIAAASAAHAGDSGCWFMRSNTAQKIVSRYRNLHAKYALIDSARLLIGSENFGMRGMPDDDKSDGTYGHRGALVLLDAPALVARAQAIFDADANLLQRDITRWCDMACEFGLPEPGFVPVTHTGGMSYTARFPEFALTDAVTMSLSSSPESHLNPDAGILALFAQAQAGDEIWAQQLNEAPYWGGANGSPERTPNPRLAALIAAAGRGVQVTLLLDAAYGGDEDANEQTVADLTALSLSTLRVLRMNPTGAGIHNKMLLIRLGDRAFVHLGSWNGTETSAKLNREMSVLIESRTLFDYFLAVMQSDLNRHRPVLLPLIAARAQVPSHVLISEVMIDPQGDDAHGEWIELHNPTSQSVQLSDYKIGDVIRPLQPSQAAGEAQYRFPPGSTIAPGETIVVAQNAHVFRTRYGRLPDFDLGGYDAAVTQLQKIENYIAGTLALANDGDEVALLQSNDILVDVVSWLDGNADYVKPFSTAITTASSLQRWPVNTDTENCTVDFRLQGIPSPGSVP